MGAKTRSGPGLTYMKSKLFIDLQISWVCHSDTLGMYVCALVSVCVCIDVDACGYVYANFTNIYCICLQAFQIMSLDLIVWQVVWTGVQYALGHSCKYCPMALIPWVVQELSCQIKLSFYCRPGRLLPNTRSLPIRSYLLFR